MVLSIKKVLIAPKVAYFFFFFSYSSVSPYIAVFMSANGLNPEQCGYIIGARLFAQFISGPIWGAIADRSHKNKLLLILQIFISTGNLFSTPWVSLALSDDTELCHQGDRVWNNSSYNGTVKSTPALPLFTFSGNFQIVANSSADKIPAGDTISMENPLKRFNDSNVNMPFTTGLQNMTSMLQNEQSACKRPTNTLFIIMIILFVLVGSFEGGILLLIDNYVVQLIENVPGCEFGKQRLWGAVGFGIASFASGLGMDLSGAEGPNYFTMFYIYLASNTLLVIPCYLMDMTRHNNATKPCHASKSSERDLRSMIKKIVISLKKFNVAFFFVTVFVMGMADNLLNAYMFLYIRDLNGTKVIMGLSIVVACSSEATIFPFTDKIIKLLRGNLVAVALAFAMYSLRFLGFSLLANPWHILPIQLLHSVCFALFWAAAVYHTKDLAPKGMKATFLGILNGMFFGISGGIASIVGGVIYNLTGGRTLFRSYSLLLLIWTVFLVLHIIEQKKNGKLRSNDKTMETEEDMKEAVDEPSASEDLLQKM